MSINGEIKEESVFVEVSPHNTSLHFTNNHRVTKKSYWLAATLAKWVTHSPRMTEGMGPNPDTGR